MVYRYRYFTGTHRRRRKWSHDFREGGFEIFTIHMDSWLGSLRLGALPRSPTRVDHKTKNVSVSTGPITIVSRGTGLIRFGEIKWRADVN